MFNAAAASRRKLPLALTCARDMQITLRALDNTCKPLRIVTGDTRRSKHSNNNDAIITSRCVLLASSHLSRLGSRAISASGERSLSSLSRALVAFPVLSFGSSVFSPDRDRERRRVSNHFTPPLASHANKRAPSSASRRQLENFSGLSRIHVGRVPIDACVALQLEIRKENGARDRRKRK